MDANKVAQEKALANPKMKFLWNTVVDSFEGDDMLKQVVLKNVKTGQLQPVDVDTCFLFIGYVPNTKIFEGFVDMTNRGYIKTNEDMETSKEGVYAVGDCRDKTLRQVATAVGDGAVAGFMAEKYVEEVNYIQKEIFEAKGLIMAFVYNASEPLDREYLARIEQLQRERKDKFQLRRIDVYKSDRIACRLSYTKSPSLLCIKNGEVLHGCTDLNGMEEKIDEIIKQYS
jgi:thioredoxin reductase (NADPH)